MRVLIQYNLNHVMKGIKAEKATDMKDVTHHAQNATMWSFWNGQPSTRPDHHIVSECTEKQQHLLSFKALLIAFGETQSLLVAFQRGFDPSTALIVKGHISSQDRDVISHLGTGAPEHLENLLTRQR